MILAQLSVAEPLLQPEGFLDNVTVLRPKALALGAGVGTHASRFFHRDECAVVFYRKQPVALPLDMQVKVFEAKKIEKLCGTKTQKTASDEISDAKLGWRFNLRVCLSDELPGISTRSFRRD